MQIRYAALADIDKLHRVRMAVHENQLTDPAKVTVKDYTRMLEGQGVGWVCEDGEQLVGFAIADLATASIWGLFVLPDYEGRGIGKKLHNTMLNWCFEYSSIKELWLTTDPNTRAEAFYRQAGWQPAGTESNGEIRFVITKKAWQQLKDTPTNWGW